MKPLHIQPSDNHRGALLWQWDTPMTALTSAPVGGGLRELQWLMNVSVPHDYSRTDLTTHADEIAAANNITGTGATMFTAVDVTKCQSVSNDDAIVDATVGVTTPTWAALLMGGSLWGTTTDVLPRPRSGSVDGPRLGGDVTDVLPRPRSGNPGTINIIVQLPVELTPAALVNAVITATEAKTQALIEAGIDGTGTPTDAIAIVYPTQATTTEEFAGPRSPWGARIANAVHAAVSAGIQT